MEEKKNMSYEDNRNCVSCATPAVLQETEISLSAMMDQASSMAQKVLTMAREINSHMFGGIATLTEGEAPSVCFRDILDNQIKTLDKAVYELSSTMEELGVRTDA